MIKISPSILNCDFSKLGYEIKRIEEAGADMIHLDVMDGVFVPNISFGFPVLDTVRKLTELPLDVHLMITEPQRYIDEFAERGADIITFHTEATDEKNIGDIINQIKSHNVKAALSVKPNTDESVIIPYLPELDMVLIMTVEPGFGGQKMMPFTLDKVRRIRDAANKIGKAIDIQVDGGAGPTNHMEVKASGANVFVVGTAVFKAENPAEVIKMIKE